MAGDSQEPVVFEFDVFLSFTGEDSRSNFGRSLFDALTSGGMRTCFGGACNTGDQEYRSSGSIHASDVFVPILTKAYVESVECLAELAMIVAHGRKMLPVFLNVNPSDVRRQKGALERALREYGSDGELGELTVVGWRKALTAVGEVKGYDLTVEEPRHDIQLIELVVREVLRNLITAPLEVAQHPVGLDFPVKQLKQMLDISAEDVRMVGIVGMGGIGKTTLVKEIYNQLSQKFESSVFLSNIREVSRQPSGLVILQNELLTKVFEGRVPKVQNVSRGTAVISERIHSRKVLLVLDDVDHINQLQALAQDRDWFQVGSRIIITTRDEHVLNVQRLKEDEIYRARNLHYIPSLKLFSFHAFGREQPAEDFAHLSRDIVVAINGLPLALIVVGSSLFGCQNKEDWKQVLQRLKHARHDEVQKMLRISYDRLDDEEKRIFLDLACFFIGMDKQEAVYIWEGCGFFAKITIKVFLHRSLITIDSMNKLEMHDQIRDMGRLIVEEESPNPGMRSRLWDQEDIFHVLNNMKGTGNVEGIALDFDENEQNEIYLSSKNFRSLENLRLLKINHANFRNGVRYLPANLRWLQWQGCGMSKLPRHLNLKKLAILDLSHSQIQDVQEEPCFWIRTVDDLKVLILNYCPKLLATPNFSRHPKLMKLELRQCQSLGSIHDSIGMLKNLVSLNLSDCSNLRKLPDSIVKLKSLKILILSGCSKISRLPKRLGKMELLQELLVDGTAIQHLPDSVVHLQNLHKLSLDSCLSLKTLPGTIGRLTSLKELSLNYTKVREIPNSIGSLKMLREFHARSCENLTVLPHSIGELNSLEILELDHSSITELPNKIGTLTNLQTLSIRRCKKLKALPSSMGGMKTLYKIHMDETLVSKLPEDFGTLSNLRTLEMRNCLVKFLPENFGGLKELRTLYVNKNSGIIMLPASVSKLHYLEELDASKCNLVEGAIPTDIGNLTSLVKLELSHNSFCSLPITMSSLANLEEFSLDHCRNLQSLPPLPSSLSKLTATYCPALQEMPDISNLQNLVQLKLTNCPKLSKLVGHERMKSLRFLHVEGCSSLGIETINKISKETFQKLEYLGFPGTKIPSSLTHQQPFCEIPKLSGTNIKLKGVVLCFLYCISEEVMDELQDLPNFIDIQIKFLVGNKLVFGTTPTITGIPKSHEDQVCFCHFKEKSREVYFLRDGGKIEVVVRSPPYIRGAQLKKVGFKVLYKNIETLETCETLQEDCIFENLGREF